MERVLVLTYLKGKYGKLHPRKTEIRNFDTIEVTKVVEANQKLYINRQEGFVGTGLKKDEFVCNCSDLDDIIIFYKDGKFKVTKVADKIFVGKNILHVQVFKKNDKRTIYNCVYRNGKQGEYFIKRFNVTAMTRDKMYDITQGTPGSRIIYFTANPNGEAEVIKVTMEPDLTKKRQSIFLEKDFSDILIKGRAAKGNLLTKRTIRRIGLKSHGHSTLGGRKVWFDPDVNRINYDENGRLLGEFFDDDSILVVLDNGEFYITNFDVNNHYEDNILRLEKWDEHKIWTIQVKPSEAFSSVVQYFATNLSQSNFTIRRKFALSGTGAVSSDDAPVVYRNENYLYYPEAYYGLAMNRNSNLGYYFQLNGADSVS